MIDLWIIARCVRWSWVDESGFSFTADVILGLSAQGNKGATMIPDEKQGRCNRSGGCDPVAALLVMSLWLPIDVLGKVQEHENVISRL